MRISGALRERTAAPEASRAPGQSACRARATAAPAVPRTGHARGLTAGRGLRPSRVPARSRPAGPAGVQGLMSLWLALSEAPADEHLPRCTNTETKVREVLFQVRTIFQVKKITNYDDLTFFVWVDEVDPSSLGPKPQTKNPWSGAVNR